MIYLVCFREINGNDVQYHAFNKVDEITQIFHDNIFKSAIGRGYMWSAIPFPEELIYKCGFTISDVERS